MCKVELSQIVQTKMAQDPAKGQALMAKLQPIMIANQGEMASGGTIDWNKVLRSVRCSYRAGTVKGGASVFSQLDRVGLRWSQYLLRRWTSLKSSLILKIRS